MRTATIDFTHGEFNVTVFRDGQRLAIHWGTYPEVMRFALAAGAQRGRISLTQAAQHAAADIFLGGAA